MSSGRRAAHLSRKSLALRGLPLFAGIAGIASPLYMQLSRLVLGALALPRGGGFRTNPEGGLLFQAADGWPPFILPSGVFWLVAAAMLTLIVIVHRHRDTSLDFALQPFVLTFWCGLGAFYAWLHSHFFIEVSAWPRDALEAALVLSCECLAFFVLGVLRSVRWAVKRRRRKVASQDGGPSPAVAGSSLRGRM